MTAISLAEDLIPAVESGTKKVTIRIGHRDYTTGPALIGGVPVEITKVVWSRLFAVPLSIVQADGFDNRADMLEVMQRFYPNIHSGSAVTIVHFEKGES